FDLRKHIAGVGTGRARKGRGGNRPNALRPGWNAKLGLRASSAVCSYPACRGSRHGGANGRRARSRDGSSRRGGKKRGTALGGGDIPPQGRVAARLQGTIRSRGLLSPRHRHRAPPERQVARAPIRGESQSTVVEAG